MELLTDKGVQTINEVRKEKGLTIRGLARKTGISHTAISGWINQTRGPKRENCKKLYAALGEDRRIRFLHEYYDGNRREKWRDYFSELQPLPQRDLVVYHALKSELHERINELEEKMQSTSWVLEPFYARLEEAYKKVDGKRKCALLIGLEKFIADFE